MVDDLETSPLSTPRPTAPIPHRIFHNVLGQNTVDALLDYACEQRADFTPARSYDRGSGESTVNTHSRSCWRLTDLAGFREPILDFITTHAASAARDMGLFETALEPQTREICAYEDGGFFTRHIDTINSGPVRVLTCIYYFSTTPREFEGGELRLHSLPARNVSQGYFDVPPDCDTLVMFPSLLRHEVLPVIKPSKAWRANRFNITSLVHRSFQAEDKVG